MATLAVGDVHGQLDHLQRMLRVAGASRVVCVGDLVGRGPDSLGVLRLLADAGDRVQVTLGNHDLHMLWVHQHGQPPGADLGPVLEAADADALCTWLRGQHLAVDLPECAALVVHAGLWHGWDAAAAMACAHELERELRGPAHGAALAALYGNDHLAWQAAAPPAARWQATVNIMTRMRASAVDGSMVLAFGGRPGEAMPAGATPWYDHPHQVDRGRLVVCGHWSALGLLVRPDVAMLDTGCCFGGPLAGMWLEERRLEFVV